MKYFVLIITFTLLLSSCSLDWNNSKEERIAELEKQISDLSSSLNNKSYLEEKGLCFSKGEEYKNKLKYKSNILSIFYSPILKSCIIEENFDGSLPPDSEQGNYNAVSFTDILSGEKLGSISYWDRFGFEDNGFLPKICNKEFILGDIGGTVNLLPQTEKSDLINKIYSAVYQYENCLSFIKGKGGIKVSVFTNGNEYSPTFITPPINY